MTEPLDLDPIKARERAATKGPWKAKPTARGRCDGISPDYHNHDGSDCHEADSDDCPAMSEIVTTDSGVYGPTWPDAEFIAHAREDIPALLAEVARLRAVVASPNVEINSLCVEFDARELRETEVVRRRQRDGTSLWRVKRLSSVLNKAGEWEYEPIPSSRDDDFVARASWPTMEEAIEAYRRTTRPPGASCASEAPKT